MYVIGIDGGGTKTTGVVATLAGQELATATVGPTNPNSLEPEYIRNELKQLFALLEEQIPDLLGGISACFAGIAGADRPSNKQLLQEILAEVLPAQAAIQVDNDAVNALYSGTLGEPGIVNIAGTGSIAFGLNDQGKRQRVGGWGYLMGDPGSGYAIGRAGLIAFFEEVDGYTQEKSLLTQLIFQQYQTNYAYDLVEHIYALEKSRTVISSVTKLVFQAADQGDRRASQILQQAAQDMVRQIQCLLGQLYAYAAHTEVQVPVVLTGGIYQRAEWFLPTLEQEFENYAIKASFIVPDKAPVAGAVIAAQKLLNQ